MSIELRYQYLCNLQFLTSSQKANKTAIERFATLNKKCPECTTLITYEKRTHKFCSRRCVRMFYNKKFDTNQYSEEEVVEYYKTHNLAECLTHFKTSWNSIKKKVSPLSRGEAIKKAYRLGKGHTPKEVRSKAAHKAIRNTKKSNTIPEQKVNSIFKEKGIILSPQYSIGSYLVDFALPDRSISIEVHGDYWHANPRVYTGILTKPQIYNRGRDRLKKRYLERLGWVVRVIWELDIPELEKCQNEKEIFNFLGL